MTQPDDVTQALPTQQMPPAPPAHPRTPSASTEEPTVSLHGGEPTVSLGGGEPTVSLDQTVRRMAPNLGATDEDLTVSLGPAGMTTYAPTATGAYAVTHPGQATAAQVAFDTVRTTGAQPGGGAFAAPITGPGGELRFGPGVPAGPPPAPAWPTPVPAPRPRSAWRRLVSVLSTLLTLALIAAVGLWIWQRLDPLEIGEVSIVVPRPAGARCDVTVDVVATVHTNGRAGTIEYQWLRSGSAPGALLRERVGPGQRTVELTLRWSFSGVGSTTETATVNIVSPSSAQAVTEVAYACPG
uniref:Uncharacterized protein n=1 Tax=Verrucosispora sp. MS100047 TaxID=1410949 RepID=A0A097CRN4_9ACTN|nr:hypothetical protein VASRM7_70 [Verrucosispora sp. MS100047]